MVRDDLTLPYDGGEIPKSQGRGWWFKSRMWKLLSTLQKICRSTASCALALACQPSISKKKLKLKSKVKLKSLEF